VGAILFVGLGGFFGAVARYLFDVRITTFAGAGFPWGTLVVNAVGSFFVGLLFALVVERAALSADLRGPLMIGFLGSFTTFSTFMLESWRMVEDGFWVGGLANIGVSVIVGLVAVVGGVALGRAM
jgi:fluoride exporter